MSRALEDRVNAMAAQQHGVVTHAQLENAGMSRGSRRHRLATGRLRPLFRGVYLVGPIMPPHARRMAAVLACGRGALLSHDDAGALWLEAMPSARHDAARSGLDEPVNVTVGHTGRSRRPGIRLHRVRRIAAADRTTRHGIPVTTPIRTVLDLASVTGASQLEQLIATLARERLLDLDELGRRVAACRGRKGIPTLRTVLEQSGGPALTRSEAEAVFLALIRKAGLPAPESNLRVGAYELDFYWRAERLAVEIDGFRHHSSRPRFEGDRRKDAWLRARGVSVIRLSWRQISHEAMATAVQVGQALMHAAR